MATSGSFSTSKVGNFYFTFEWYRTGYSSSANENYIHYTLYAHNTVGNYRTVYLKDLYVNGSQVFYNAGASSSGKAYYEGDVVTSGDATIKNSNSAGDGSFSASFSAGVGTYPSSNCSGSGSWNLDRIPRYATSAQSLSSKTETTITMDWSSDSTIDYIWYSKDNGSNWTAVGSVNAKSGSYTISGLAYLTEYKIKTRVRRKDSQLTTDSSSITVTTYDIPYCKATSNFTIGETPTLEIYNPLSRNVTVSVIGENNSVLYTTTTTGTSVKISNSSTTKTTMYNSIPNTTSGVYKVKTSWNGYEWTRESGSMYSINASECIPTFTNFEYKDVGGVSTSLTGNNQIVINGYNVIEVTISTSNKAVAKNGASISKYRAVCGNKSDEKNYSSSSTVTLTLDYITDMTFIVYAIDSRGLSTSVMKSVASTNWKDYFYIAMKSASIERDGGVGTESTLAFEGNIWNGNFGATQNAIQECKYRYKKTNESTYSSYINVTPTLSGNTFNFSGKIKGDLGANGFNMSNSFNIEVCVKDKIRETTYSILLGAGSPAMAIHPNGVAFGAPYDVNIGGNLQVNGQNIENLASGVSGDTLPIGAVVEYVGNTPPANWVQVDDEKKEITTGQEYATNEYIDGKRVYEKIYSTTTVINGAEVTRFSHGISGATKIWLDLANSYFICPNQNNRCLPIIQTFYTTVDSTDKVNVYIEGSYFYVVSSGGWGTHWEKVFRFRYVK